MAATSTMLPLGTQAPVFALPDVTSGEIVRLEDFAADDALLVMFICAHCPYAISANDPETYPEDAPEGLARDAADAGYLFPYLFDESQEIAKAYTAACTPDFFLFDRDRALVYRGQLDDSRPGNGKPVDGHDLRTAIDAVLAGTPVDEDQRPSVGCSIKWRDGNEPA
jgi:peroxiredoxin